MKTNQKTITINGTRYTAAKLRKMAATADEFMGGDKCAVVDGGEIAIRIYGDDQVAVLNYGLVSRHNATFGQAVAFLA